MRLTAQELARISARIHAQAGLGVATRLSGLIETKRRPGKYGNVPVRVGEYRFDSKLEARRFRELDLLQAAGRITRLRFHSHWDLHFQGVKLGYYESDFDYVENGEHVIEDCKGAERPTDLYVWKKKHIKAEYGITIREIRITR